MSHERPPLADPLDDLAGQLRQSRQLEAPPSWATHRLLALWPTHPVAPPNPATPPLRRLLAQWAQAIAGDALALGLRGDPTGWRQWMFQAEDHDIELRLRPDPRQPEQRWQLQGQVLGPDCQGQLCLRAQGSAAEPLTVPLDALGAFQVDGLSSGSWQLQVQLGDRWIDLPTLDWPDAGTG